MGVKISELNEATSAQNSDVLPIVQNGETKKISKEIFLKSVLSLTNNSGFHNSIYRGKDITDLFYNGTLSQQIAAGTFDDIYIGDYIIGQNSGRKYLVADINYYLHSGDTECTTNHVLMIPERTMGKAQMNTTNTTTGAYIGSAMYTNNLATAKTTIKNDFGTNHILTHRNYFANAVTNNYESGGVWTNSDIDLMNEIMVFGSNIFHNVVNQGTVPSGNITLDNSQLALFRYKKDLMPGINENGGRQIWWLRDVINGSNFAIVHGFGNTGFTGAANSDIAVRPSFLVY